VTVIAAQGTPTAMAAKAATTTIPIVFGASADAVAVGLVTNLGRPDGNLTGITGLSITLEPKRLGLLHKLAPRAETVAILIDPHFPTAASQSSELEAGAHIIGLKVSFFRASTDREVDAVFESIVQHRITALLITAHTFFLTRIDKLVSLAAHHRIPTIYPFRD